MFSFFAKGTFSPLSMHELRIGSSFLSVIMSPRYGRLFRPCLFWEIWKERNKIVFSKMLPFLIIGWSLFSLGLLCIFDWIGLDHSLFRCIFYSFYLFVSASKFLFLPFPSLAGFGPRILLVYLFFFLNTIVIFIEQKKKTFFEMWCWWNFNVA